MAGESAASAAKAAETQAAAISSAALAACKNYMRVDGDEDDGLIAGLMAAAKEYLDGAGIPEPSVDSKLYTMAVQSLTLHYYDHRDSTGAEAPIPNGLRPIINQLKHSGEMPL